MAAEKKALFGGGCFWCMEPPFEGREGVLDVSVGYSGGTTENPTYAEVSSGRTGHYETVQIVYDSEKIRYEELLDIFWHQIDPTDPGGQFADRGSQYGSVIFYLDEEQRRQAEASKKRLAASGIFAKPLVTAILPATPFYRAEEYHQHYYRKHALQYTLYKQGSGRADFLETTWKKSVQGGPPPAGWKKPDAKTLKRQLTSMQYKVTQEEGTEPAFANAFWDNQREGIYVDVVSGEVLFSSKDKFDSGTGWPSFTRPLEPDNVVERTAVSFFLRRTEVRSRLANSHLGHVFDDGPPPGHKRYCINSAALRFVPKERLMAEGYGRYRSLFAEKSRTE